MEQKYTKTTSWRKTKEKRGEKKEKKKKKDEEGKTEIVRTKINFCELECNLQEGTGCGPRLFL